MKEERIMNILDKHDIEWSWFSDCVFVGKDRVPKVMDIKDELLKVKTCKQGFDDQGNYIAFAKV